MNTRKLICIASGLAAIAILNGCAIQAGKAGGITQSMSYPLIFKDTIDAKGIKKVKNEDGTETYIAESLTHGTTILGFERNVNYTDVEVTVKEPKK